MEDLLGLKIIGFDWSNHDPYNDYLGWMAEMWDNIGVEGVITELDHSDNSVRVLFPNGSHLWYPMDLAIKNLVEKSVEMNKKMYVVKYSSGSYEDYYIIDVFVTTNKHLAEKWINKFNNRLEYWKNVIKQYSDEDGCLARKYWDIPFTGRYWKIRDTNKAFLDEIEVRI